MSKGRKRVHLHLTSQDWKELSDIAHEITYRVMPSLPEGFRITKEEVLSEAYWTIIHILADYDSILLPVTYCRNYAEHYLRTRLERAVDEDGEYLQKNL